MRYQQYIDSKVNWIGLVPNDWQRTRIKFGIRRSAAGVWGNDEKGNSDDVICFRIADFDYPHGELKLDNITLRNIEKNQLEGRLLSYGDLLIEKSGGGDATPVGRVVRVNYEGKATCSNFIHSLTLNEKLDNNFMYYYFHFLYSNKVNLLFFNQTTGLQNLKVSDYLSQSIYVPTIDEQKAIANYLGIQCAKIDKVIAAQEKRVELLQELKQSIITRAVTKGINSHVKMRDSGVEWIGQIPEHWEIKKLKYLFSNLDYLRQPITADQRSKNNPIYDYYGASGIIDKIDFYNVDDTVLLIGEDGANLVFRNLPLIYKASGKFWVNNHAHILKPLIGVDYEYMYYTMECADYSTFITGSAQPKLSQENMNQVQYPLPPLSEQCKISKYIERKTIKIDSFITKALCQIELLKEYKQSLITEVVTGKRKVS